MLLFCNKSCSIPLFVLKQNMQTVWMKLYLISGLVRLATPLAKIKYANEPKKKATKVRFLRIFVQFWGWPELLTNFVLDRLKPKNICMSKDYASRLLTIFRHVKFSLKKKKKDRSSLHWQVTTARPNCSNRKPAKPTCILTFHRKFINSILYEFELRFFLMQLGAQKPHSEMFSTNHNDETTFLHLRKAFRPITM